MTLNDLTVLVEKNALACDNPNSRDMLATDGSQDRKYLTLADETRATAFQTVLRPLEDRHLVACGVKKGCREEAAERATSDCDFERVHWSELPIQSSRVSFWQKAGCLHAPRPGRLRISPRIGDGVNFQRLVRTVEKLDGGEPQIGITDVFKIMDLIFTCAIHEVTRVARRVGRLDNGAILRMRPGPASCDGSPEIVEHVPMKSDPLTRSEPNFPDAHAIGFRQKPSADSTIELICLELLANGAGPGRRDLLNHVSGHSMSSLVLSCLLKALFDTQSGLCANMLRTE